jgi:hypothetical protein
MWFRNSLDGSKLVVSMSREPTVRSRLTVLLLRQDLDHGTLFQIHLVFWIILKSSCLSNGKFRLFHYACSTTCCLAPILPLFFKLPDFIIPLELSDQNHQHFPSVSFVLKRLPSVFLSTSNPRVPTSLVFRLARLFRIVQILYRTNPRSRTSNFCLSTRSRKSS